MSTQYYYQPTGKVLSALDVEVSVGVDPTTYGLVGLNGLGVYPVTEVVQPFNLDLYTVALTYTIAGSYAVETWTPTAIALADAKVAGIKNSAQTTAGRIKNLREESGFGARIFVAVASLTSGSRPAPVGSWMTRQEETITDFGANYASINAATTVDQINDIASAAWGCINIGYDPASPLDLLASDFTTDKFYSKNLTAADLELYFPQTTTTVSYSSGFAATVGAMTAEDHSVQLRIASNSLVIDEFCVPPSATVVQKPFGFNKYEGLGSVNEY